MTRDWDARTYDRVADPMTRWGAAVLDRLPLDGDERVLDAGCGSGRVTELLAERLPQRPGRRARRLAGDGRGRRASGSPASATGSSTSSPTSARRCRSTGPVDAVLSTATFHWVPDHDALFANLAAVLAPGGWLVAQCGGVGNIANDPARSWRRSATAGSGRSISRRRWRPTTRLDAAGFVDIECWLTDEPTRFEPGEPFETYLRTVVLGAHLERLPPAERDAFVHEVADAASANPSSTTSA